MHWKSLLLAFALLALPLCALAEDGLPPATGEYSVPGAFAIGTPAGGHRWEFLEEIDLQGVASRSYRCRKPGSQARIVLGVVDDTIKTDKDRAGFTNGFHNLTVKSKQFGVFTEIQESKPKVDPPVADRVPFSFIAKKADGTALYMRGIAIFGKRAFVFQAFADSQAAVDEMFKISESLRELEPDPNAPPPPFQVVGEFAVDTPAGGYQWKLFKELELPDKSKGRIFTCLKPQGTLRGMLTIEGREAKDDATRIATLKAYYNSTVESAQQLKFTEPKVTRPNLTTPIPDRVAFAIDCKQANGSPLYIRSLTIFGKKIYQFQVHADSVQEADAFMKAAESLRELE